MLSLVAEALLSHKASQRADNGVGVARNGDGPLVGREPSAENITTTQEQLMSDPERKGTGQPAEGPRRHKWRRLRRLRNEAGVHLVRGAATAVGGIVMTYSALWIQTRV